LQDMHNPNQHHKGEREEFAKKNLAAFGRHRFLFVNCCARAIRPDDVSDHFIYIDACFNCQAL
jgi:hypothetical protein